MNEQLQGQLRYKTGKVENPNNSAGWNDAAANTLISWRRTECTGWMKTVMTEGEREGGGTGGGLLGVKL